MSEKHAPPQRPIGEVEEEADAEQERLAEEHGQTGRVFDKPGTAAPVTDDGA